MKINTMEFGEMELETSQVVTLPQGIPGFEQLRQFIFVYPEPESPFYYLQSVEHEEISFVIGDPFAFFHDYEVLLPDTLLEDLHIKKETDVRIGCMVTVNEAAGEVTMNLMAPLVFNLAAQLGKQLILHQSEYKIKQQLTLDYPDQPGMAGGG